MRSPVEQFQAGLGALDRYQRDHDWVGFPVAVAKKFGDDNAGYLASLVAYYGFFSLFPLLLVFVTVLGFVVGGKTSGHVVSALLHRIPIIGTTDVHSMRGSGIGLAIGIVLTLLAGTSVVQALQYGLNQVWDVPLVKRPNFLKVRLKALLTLAIFGAASLVGIGLAGLGSSNGALLVFRFLAPAVSLAVNIGVVLIAFRLLTDADLSWSALVPGAAATGVALTLLQVLGGLYVAHLLNKAGQTYGAFATVIALLSWIYLGAQLTFYGAEVNVVRSRRLWPRSLRGEPTDADRLAASAQVRMAQRRPDENVHVGFDEPRSA